MFHQKLRRRDHRVVKDRQDRLLQEQVEFGFLLEADFNRAALERAHRFRQPQHHVPGLTAGVLRDGDEAGEALAGDIALAHRRAQRPRRDQPHIDKRRRFDEAVGQVIGAAEDQRLPAPQMRRDVFQIDFRHRFVAQQRHDHVRGAHDFFDLGEDEAFAHAPAPVFRGAAR